MVPTPTFKENPVVVTSSLQALLETPQTGTAREVYSQFTIARMLQLLLELLAEPARHPAGARGGPGRLLWSWDPESFPLLPHPPHARDFTGMDVLRLDFPPDIRKEWLCLALNLGSEQLVFIGRLVETPSASVFQQRLPIDLRWGFSSHLLGDICRLFDQDVPAKVRANGAETLERLFEARFIKLLENNLLESRHSLKLITGILRVQKAISSELDFERLLELLGGIMVETFGFSFGELDLVNASGQLLHTVSWNSGDLGSDTPDVRILLDAEEQQRIFQGGLPVVLADVMHHPLILNQRLVGVLGLRNAILLPLITGEDKVGLLKLFYSHNLHLSSERLGWLEELSVVLASAIQNAREHTRVFELATKDGLTNIHNRRYFEEQFDLEVERLKRKGGSLCLLMLDVDHFKNYNDQNGHLAGDHVLIQVARLIKTTIRTVDFVARYGGEEFIVLLSGASLIQGWRVAEKIRRRIQDEPFVNEKSQPGGRLTISVGVAAYQPGMKRLSDLISKADKALYTAKGNGRNQVALNEEPLDAPASEDN